MKAPGPGAGVLFELRSLRRDPLGYMRRSQAEFGDLVRLGAGGATVHLLGHIDFAEQVLRRNHQNYDRATRSAAAMRELTGDSILTKSGEEWRHDRLLLQPSFHHDAVQSFGELIVAEARKSAASLPQERPVDIAAEMTRVTFAIAGRAFFGADLAHEVEKIERLVPEVLQETFLRSTAVIPLYRFVKRERDRRFESAIAELHSIVRHVVSRNTSQDNLLGRMFAARSEDGEMRLSEAEIENDTLALLLAGHETTANALAWTLYLLARHAGVRKRVAAEIDAIGSRHLAASDTRALPFTTAVILEAIRLYPSIWIVERRALEDEVIGGYDIPKDSIVYVSPYILHRHAEFWADAERFDPDRFMPDPSRRKSSYLPFGAGPHHCIGSHFAMLEAKLILATYLQHFDFEMHGASPIAPQAHITLRPSSPVELVLRKRKESAASASA